MGEVCTEWYFTMKMIVDFMTKPLQGAVFVKFCDIIMWKIQISEGNSLSQEMVRVIK
jgi:hypothetical protein